jgi:hypothetical protein
MALGKFVPTTLAPSRCGPRRWRCSPLDEQSGEMRLGGLVGGRSGEMGDVFNEERIRESA